MVNIFLSILRFYRVRDWIKNLGIPLIGMFLASPFNLSFILPLVQFSLAYSFAFSINDTFDLNKRKKLYLLVSLIPLFILFPMLQFNSTLSLLFILLFVFLFFLYSVPVMQLKRHFIFSIPINSLCIGAFTFLGSYFFFSATIHFKEIILSTFFTCLIAIYEIIHQISHMRNDKKSNLLSLPVVIGIRNSMKTAIAIQIFVLLVSIFSLIVNFWSNLIFVGSIMFSFLRIRRLQSWRQNISKLRDRIFGLEEGIFYLLFSIFYG